MSTQAQSHGQPETDLHAPLLQHAAENAAGVGAEHHSQTELRGPLIDRERHDAVDADGGEREVIGEGETVREVGVIERAPTSEADCVVDNADSLWRS